MSWSPPSCAAPSSTGVRYDRLWDYFADTEECGTEQRLADPRRRLRRHRRGHRHRAPGARLRRGRPGRLRRGRHPGHPVLDDGGRFLPSVPEVAGQHWFDANKPLTAAAERRRPAVPAEVVRAQLPALLALPQSAHLQGGVELVRARARDPRPHGRAQPADHLGARERQGRPVRQVALERPRLVDQPQPLLGLADPGLEERRPRVPARRRLRLARRARARLRRAARPTCTARSSTS